MSKGFAGFVVVAACLLSACGAVATKYPGGSGGSSDAQTTGSGGEVGSGGSTGAGGAAGSGGDSGAGGMGAAGQSGSGGSGGAPPILVRAGIVPLPSGSTLAGATVVVARQGLSVPAPTLCNSSVCVVNGGIVP